MADLDSQLLEQARIINVSHALASEASRRSKQVAGEAKEASLQVWLPLAAWVRSPAWPVRECAENQLSGLVVEGQWRVLLSHEHPRAWEVRWAGAGGGRTEAQECQRQEVRERVSLAAA